MSSTPSRSYTTEECRHLLLERLRSLVKYWATTSVTMDDLDRELGKNEAQMRLEGLTHSILALLDGHATDFPGFKLEVTCESGPWPNGTNLLEEALHEEFMAEEFDVRRRLAENGSDRWRKERPAE